ncbi:hypothetical protein [Sulfitobacter pontiacus]|uniref:hypothetical protein n=1 Tax=Sulfitobacter pontiacus TaxID=60137 RepID=UPI0030EE4D81
MALPTSYRWVSIGKLTIRNQKTAPAGAPRFSLADLIGALQAKEGIAAGMRSFQNDDRRMWCSPTLEDDAYYSLLMQAGDKKVSDVAFIDFDTLNARNGGKRDSEGGHFCAHVLIKKAADAVGKHLVLIEKVPNIHFSSLKAHFNWILNDPALRKSFLVDGTDKQYRGTAEFEGYQSKTLREAMTSGTIQELEFIGNERLDAGVDEDDLVRETVHEVHWTVKRRVDADGAQRLVSKALRFLRGWEDVEADKSQLLVRIKAENGQVKTAAVTAGAEEIEDATAEALENAFYLNEIISDFDEPLTQRYDGFRDDVLTKLKDRARALEAQ